MASARAQPQKDARDFTVLLGVRFAVQDVADDAVSDEGVLQRRIVTRGTHELPKRSQEHSLKTGNVWNEFNHGQDAATEEPTGEIGA